jgi:uncharacterized protein YggE
MMPARPLVLALALGLAALAPRGALADAAPPARLTVTGEGTTAAAPDMATITLGVVTEAETAAEALARNNTAMGALLDRLGGAGIAPRDLQTTGLDLSPRHEFPQDGGQPRLVGFTAQNMVMVRVRDLDSLGSILSLAVEDGANSFNGLRFSLSDPQAALAAAQVAAVADAQAKAARIAGAAGVRLGPIVEITEAGRRADPMPMMRASAEAVMDAVPVAGGEVSYAASVTIVWAIEQD